MVALPKNKSPRRPSFRDAVKKVFVSILAYTAFSFIQLFMSCDKLLLQNASPLNYVHYYSKCNFFSKYVIYHDKVVVTRNNVSSFHYGEKSPEIFNLLNILVNFME